MTNSKEVQFLTDCSPEFQQFLLERYGVEDEDYILRVYHRGERYLVFAIFGDQEDYITYNIGDGTWTFVD